MLRENLKKSSFSRFWCLTSLIKMNSFRARTEIIRNQITIIYTNTMPLRGVTLNKGETVDRALKRMKTLLDNEGILEEMRRRRSFETPVERAKRKLRSASKRKKQRFKYTSPTQDATAAAKAAERAAEKAAPKSPRPSVA